MGLSMSSCLPDAFLVRVGPCYCLLLRSFMALLIGSGIPLSTEDAPLLGSVVHSEGCQKPTCVGARLCDSMWRLRMAWFLPRGVVSDVLRHLRNMFSVVAPGNNTRMNNVRTVNSTVLSCTHGIARLFVAYFMSVGFVKICDITCGGGQHPHFTCFLNSYDIFLK
jgi:hypothetical protein